MNLPAIALQLPGKVTHGAEQQHDLLLVVVGVTGLVLYLRHHHKIPIFVGVFEGTDVSSQLVAKDQNQIGHGEEFSSKYAAGYAHKGVNQVRQEPKGGSVTGLVN
jgi:hypothetical protein